MMLHPIFKESASDSEADNDDVGSVSSDDEESMHEPRGGESILWTLAYRASQHYGNNNPYIQILQNHVVPALDLNAPAAAAPQQIEETSRKTLQNKPK
ncbi:MAG: hypothetical protein HYX61_01070 [Gammaproteobacteria bacterium]|nr:hypothetical protein [Gammaproteobacteria bacterium]